ncbi:hypothetical protein FHX42_002956 [Saccharopolyspora lacisalsi]|uniref:Uncharacterized protein n=1 Tax=Halosaccharopolyspora lacisalsi TaxID=1000566 RepID=A0A839DXJ1_9PSEU|nr:hypothetical protein [Halosaccharopolyspora lacisalsi]
MPRWASFDARWSTKPHVRASASRSSSGGTRRRRRARAAGTC